jgi:hypothetical protein
MKKKILLLLVIPLLVTACAKVPQLANGEEAIVTFNNEALAISADDLFRVLMDKYALGAIIDMIDLTILQDKYPDEEENARGAAQWELEGMKM